LLLINCGVDEERNEEVRIDAILMDWIDWMDTWEFPKSRLSGSINIDEVGYYLKSCKVYTRCHCCCVGSCL
jgi:hypothetical protein